MAADTGPEVHSLVIYEVYVRQHGPHGTFADVEADLGRIRGLGVDVVWLMPIHPIGRVARHLPLGSSYAIADYREVNPEYGTREDFARLIARAHAIGLRVMIDVVFNHTAPDSVLAREHPDWFHQDEHGAPTPTVWDDVVDFRDFNPELTAYLIESLAGWVRLGVDGFRCDVASALPVEFWLRARHELAAIKPGLLWLAESVHASFVLARRAAGLTALSDGEIYRAFDLAYDYDLWPIWLAAVRGRAPVSRYLELLRFQEAIYPANAVKLRCVENHDTPRIMAFAPTRAQALAWTAFQAFNRGAFLIYAGQESAATGRPSHVDVDRIAWGGYELQPFLATLARLKKDPAQTGGRFVLLGGDPAIQAAWHRPGAGLYGVFNVGGNGGEIAVQLPDGTYQDLLGGGARVVRGGRLRLPEDAAILRYTDDLALTPLATDLLDYRAGAP